MVSSVLDHKPGSTKDKESTFFAIL